MLNSLLVWINTYLVVSLAEPYQAFLHLALFVFWKQEEWNLPMSYSKSGVNKKSGLTSAVTILKS